MPAVRAQAGGDGGAGKAEGRAGLEIHRLSSIRGGRGVAMLGLIWCWRPGATLLRVLERNACTVLARIVQTMCGLSWHRMDHGPRGSVSVPDGIALAKTRLGWRMTSNCCVFVYVLRWVFSTTGGI